MKKILLLVSLAFVSLLVCANPEDDRGVPMRAQGACPPVHRPEQQLHFPLCRHKTIISIYPSPSTLAGGNTDV